MTTKLTSRPVPGEPGTISMFFVAKAAFFAAAAWAWVLVLIGRDRSATGWELFAVAAGICFTLVAVLLGIRFANQRAAARRHDDLRRLLVELSWDTLAAQGQHDSARILHMQPGPGSDRGRR